MERFLKDLNYAFRLLGRHKGFSITAVLTLAVCIGTNAAVFSIVSGVVLRPLPFPEAGRLVTLYNAYPKAGVERAGAAVPDYFDRLRDMTAMEALAMFRNDGLTIGAAGDAERVTAMEATPSIFKVLRATPLRGRVFTAEEGEVGNERKVILSYALWQRRFGGRDDALGRDLRINGRPSVIVGVLPPDFRFTGDNDEPLIYVPASFTDRQKSDESRHSNNYTMIGRLKAGATIEQARGQLDALNKRNLDRFPEFRSLLVNAGFNSKIDWLQDDLIRDVKSSLLLLWIGAGFVLLIGGVNVANLVLVRATARLKELATRHALGASPGDIARQLITETTLLTTIGGVLGLGLGYATLTVIRSVGLERLPRSHEVQLDAAAILFTLAISVLMGLFLGVVPIFSVRRSNLSQAFREEGRSTTGGRRARIIRASFVTAQVAIALVLLVGAGLLFTSFRHVLQVDPGFVPGQVITGEFSLPGTAYPDAPAQRAFAMRALDAIRALPGVEAAGISGSIPFGDNFNSSVIFAEDYVMGPGESILAPLQIQSSDGYFQAQRIQLVRGRLFDRRDTDTSLMVMVVDERMAKKFWPNKDPIGRRMYRPTSPRDMSPGPNARFITIVGVVREVKYLGLAPSSGIQQTGTCYYPISQQPARSGFFVVRTKSSDPTSAVPGLRKVMADINPELPLFGVQTMQERLNASVANRRTPMLLALAFAGVALFLAAVGIYGVLAYQVSQRTREIGIRMALGSQVMTVFKLVLRDGMTMVGIGFIIGLAGAVAMSRGLQSQLFGVGSLDPGVISVVAVLLAVVAFVACAVPAVRAARVNPIVALVDQ